MATFGDIRALLQERFRESTWRKLVAMIDTFEGSEDIAEVVIPYCATHMERWPSGHPREAPEQWVLDMLYQRDDTTKLSLVTEVKIPIKIIEQDECRALLSCPHLGGLRRLDMGEASVSAPGMRLLVRCDRWTKLTSANFAGCGLGPKGARSLSQAPFLASITHLVLDECRLDVRGIDAILSARHLGELEHLSLSGNKLEGGLDVIAESEKFHRLKVLKLGRNRLSDAFVEKLAGAPHLANLELLDLSNCHLFDRSARELANSPHLINLISLDLRKTFISARGLYELSQSPNVSNLEFFAFESTRLEHDACTEFIQSSPYFSKRVKRAWRA